MSVPFTNDTQYMGGRARFNKIVKFFKENNMLKRKVSKAAVRKERDPKKVEKVIKEKGFKSGKLPKGKELHHIKPVAEGGKPTKKNTSPHIA